MSAHISRPASCAALAILVVLFTCKEKYRADATGPRAWNSPLLTALSAVIRNDGKLAQLVIVQCRTINPEVVGSFPAKTQKTENSNLHGFELHRPSESSKGTKLLLQVIKAIINQLQ